MASVVSSPVRRITKRKLDRLAAVKNLRDALPILNKDQIRKFRMPYHSAIMEELYEKGYHHASEFIRQLLVYQEELRQEHFYDFVLQARPLLVTSKKELDRLYQGLRAAEAGHYAHDLKTEIDELLTLASYYAFIGGDDWCWLAEQVFVQAINISFLEKSDGGFREAATLYLYGKYLVLYNMNDARGVDFLNVARIMSKGTDWCAGAITKTMEKYIFVEVCTLLYDVFSKKTKKLLKHDPIQALRTCKIAKQRAEDACLPKADVFLLQGRCQIILGQTHNAISSFCKALNLYRVNNLRHNTCKARVNLALAYLDLGDWERTSRELLELLEYAQTHNLQKFVGQAYLYIGQYNLNQGTPKIATPMLVKALNIFHEVNDVNRMEFAKNLAAVSHGQELIAKYYRLIMNCNEKEKGSLHNIDKLLKWKSMRVPFWDIMDDVDDIEESNGISTSGADPEDVSDEVTDTEYESTTYMKTRATDDQEASASAKLN